MASVPLTPVTMNAVITQGAGQFFNSSAVQGPTGTPIDLSAWVSLTAKLVAPSPNPTGGDVSFGTVTAASTGIITLETSPSDLSTAAPGTAQLRITGKPTSGDTVQLLATGVVTLQQG